MNTHPFAGQNSCADKTNRFVRTATKTQTGQSQKGRQPKQKKSKKIAQQKAIVVGLSQAEQSALLRQKALAEAQQGNHTEAITLFNCLIEQNPKNANDYSNRGLVHFQSGQSDAALADYNRAIELNPCLDSAYNNRANYYAAQGQFLEAILDYDMALDLNPTNVRAWINQGITFRELAMYDRAIDSLEVALCLGQLEGHTYAERGRTYHLRGDWNCAVADYQRALDTLPQVNLPSHNPSVRLRSQVKGWLEELIGPLRTQF